MDQVFYPAARHLSENQIEETRSIYVVLVHTQSILAKMIAAFTEDRYTHSAIALDGDLGTMYSFGRRFSRYPFWGCFKKENFWEGFYALNGTLPGIVLEINVTQEQYLRVQGTIQYFQSNRDDLHYDVKGLFLGALGVSFDSHRSYTCSKFVANVLTGAGVCTFEKPLPLVRPMDFLGLPARVVYQGDLKKYYLQQSVRPAC